jgi:hypothetical protein
VSVADADSGNPCRALVLFNAPDHIQSAEFALTQIVHSRWKIDDLKWEGRLANQRVIFRTTSDQGHDESRYSTYPTRSSGERWEKLVDKLRNEFPSLATDADAGRVADALEAELSGLRIRRIKSLVATPLSPALTMLQTPAGLAGKDNPVAIDEILEDMYELGGGAWGGVAKRYTDALVHLSSADKYVKRINSVVETGILPALLEAKSPTRSGEPSGIGQIPNSPFSWFQTAWDTITREDWVKALPARRWIEWCGAVARLAYGMGVLWEAHWYVAIADALREGTAVTEESIRNGCNNDKTLPWRTGPDAYGNDVWREYRKTNIEAALVRTFLKKSAAKDQPFQSVVDKAHRSESVRQAVDTLLEDIDKHVGMASKRVSTSAGDRIDAVESALKERLVSEGDPDAYYLLRETGMTRSKSVFVDPSTEIAAVVASLACKSPGETTTVRKVAEAFRDLGLRRDNLEAEMGKVLERAGLCRRAHDADGSEDVSCAFAAVTAV